MKKFSKLVGVALLASVFAFGFASCANGSSDDDDNGGNNKESIIDSKAIATYTGMNYSNGAIYVINCYSDGTFVEIVNEKNKTYKESIGTYVFEKSSDFENGICYINITNTVQDDSYELKKYEFSAPVIITNGKFTLLNISFTRVKSETSEVFPVIFKAAFDESTIMTFKFLEDKTFEQIVSEDSELQLLGKGTYKFTNGNFTAGTIILTCKQFLDHETKELKDVNDYPDMELEIINGTFNTIYTIERDDGESTTTTEKTVTFIKQ